MLCLVPALLVLHRAELAQRRMQPAVIVEGHPVHHRLPGLLTGSEFAPMYAGCFQPPPEAFRWGVIPAVALPAHR